MKIYMVEANNGNCYEDYTWFTIRAFSSKEAACWFVHNINEEYSLAMNRRQSLVEFERAVGLTDEEKLEMKAIDNAWYDYNECLSDVWITEYEVYN